MSPAFSKRSFPCKATTAAEKWLHTRRPCPARWIQTNPLLPSSTAKKGLISSRLMSLLLAGGGFHRQCDQPLERYWGREFNRRDCQNKQYREEEKKPKPAKKKNPNMKPLKNKTKLKTTEAHGAPVEVIHCKTQYNVPKKGEGPLGSSEQTLAKKR